jgi:linoleoyl-CoA desaturase
MVVRLFSHEFNGRLCLEHCFPIGTYSRRCFFPVADVETNKFEDEFATHQIKTTANFGTGSKTISWLVGGLNFQVEHHLFPKISHIHYPSISKIVKKVCEEYQLKYIEYKTMWGAVMAHIRFLKQMGRA